MEGKEKKEKSKPFINKAIHTLTRAANSIAVSPSARLCGGRYQTSATTAHDAQRLMKCSTNDVVLEFQKGILKSRLGEE